MAFSRTLARRLAVLALLCQSLAVAACGDDATIAATAPTPTPRPLRTITFMAGFRAQANLPFVAVYLADAKGYFAAEGLRVEVQHSAGQDEHLKLLLAKEIAFTTATGAQALLRYADGLPVRAVALFGQRGDQGFVARADSGIRTPADFRGRSIGFKSGIVPAELQALLATAGLTKDDVKLQGVGFDPRIFIERAVDVYPVFLGNEPYAIRKAGVEINVFDPADYGIATLGLTFLAHADTVSGDAELVRAFLRATLRGAQYAAEHPDEAVDATLKYAEGADPGQQRFLLDTDLASARRSDGMGRSTVQQWVGLEETLRRFGILSKPGGGAAVFAGATVDALYDGQGRLK
jgi:ABC-type nitrate/sulfonate/bicarbonate transport system substrate-binding protein